MKNYVNSDHDNAPAEGTFNAGPFSKPTALEIKEEIIRMEEEALWREVNRGAARYVLEPYPFANDNDPED